MTNSDPRFSAGSAEVASDLRAHAEYVRQNGFDMRQTTAMYLERGAAEIEKLRDPAQAAPNLEDLGAALDLIMSASCEDQHTAAASIAGNIGMILVNEPPHPDCPHERSSAGNVDDLPTRLASDIANAFKLKAQQMGAEVSVENLCDFQGYVQGTIFDALTASEPQPVKLREALELCEDVLNSVQKAHDCPDSPIINMARARAVEALTATEPQGAGK